MAAKPGVCQAIRLLCRPAS